MLWNLMQRYGIAYEFEMPESLKIQSYSVQKILTVSLFKFY